jgi:uncharacterized protein (TIGR02453 family)
MNTQSILDFLSGLVQNNNREWMEANRSQYNQARAAFEEIVNHLIIEIAAFDSSAQGLVPKDCIFRLNRDIRFSKDKSPYKTHFGAYIAEGGKKSQSAGYYLHLEPNNNSLLAGGMYVPTGDSLKKIRQEVDYNPSELMKIVSDPMFMRYFDKIQGEKLKTSPKGYSPDHPNIEFLKLKSYTIVHSISDEWVTNRSFLQDSVDVFKAMVPLNGFLNVAVS